MLAHYRVLDLTSERGHLAGHLLALLGAEVIAVEPPDGSPARHLGPYVGGQPDPEASLTHWAYNRGKRSVVLDIDDQRFDELVATADVLIDEGDLDPARLAGLNPALVHVSITPFGLDGPKADWAATDLTLWAAGGAMALTGDADRAPLRVSEPQAFHSGAAVAAAAALVALLERGESGCGQRVDLSCQQVLPVSSQSQVLASLVGGPHPARSGGGIKAGPIDLRFVWPAADGHVSITHVFGDAVGPYTRRLMEWVCEAGFCDEATRDKDWIGYGLALHTGAETLEEFDRVKVCIAAFTSSKTKAELLEGAMTRRVLVGPVTTMADVVASEQLASRGYWEDVDGVRYPGRLAHFVGDAQPPTLGRPPRLGEHTDSVLADLQRRPAVRPGKAPERPLEGLKVVDFMWALAGPTLSRSLADAGATVIRVESSVRVDAARLFQPFFDDKPSAENSALFNNVNAGKLGVTLDLGTAEGREVALDLVRWADVVCEAFSPRAMSAWGLDYASLAAVNPKLVMLSTCLMGQTGPLAMYAGFGNLAAALSGFYEITGWPDRPPVGPYAAYTDYIAPHMALAALLAGVDRQRRTGKGTYIDFAQGEAALHFLAPALLDYTVNGVVAGRRGNDDSKMAPHGAYRCAGEDRWVAVVAQSDEAWRALAKEMGREDLFLDLLFQEASGRLTRRRELDAAVEAWTCGLDAAEVQNRLQAVGVAAHQVQNTTEIVVDPQLAHRNHWQTVPHPMLGEAVVEGPRFQLSRTPMRVDRGGPSLGEHVFEVLGGLLGYDEDRIADLAAAEVFS